MSREPHESKREAPRLPTAPPPALSATIATVSVFGQSATFRTQLAPYLGDQLFCSAVSDGTTLTLFINDFGLEQLSPVVGATTAKVTVSYNGVTSDTVTISNFVYGGEKLALTATLGGTPAAQTLGLVISDPPHGSLTTNEITFVIVEANSVFQLRWVENPVSVPVAPGGPTTARVRPPRPQSGGGVSGPMGLDVP